MKHCMRFIVLLALVTLIFGCNVHRTVVLKWIASTTTNVTEYFVYRDSVRIGSVPVPTVTYSDTIATSGLHSYYVTAWNGYESRPSNTVTVTVP